MKHKILDFEEVDSTNECLKRDYEKLSEGTVITALHQTKGKGRLGREWKDDSKSLVFSLLLKQNIDPERIALLPLLTGCALYNTLKKFNLEASLKWPNDVLLEGKKCCGILLEAITKEKVEALILGIGLNLNDDSFPEEIKDKAISLHQVTGKTYDRLEVLHAFLDSFDELYALYLKKDDSYLDILRNHSFLDHKKVFLNYYGENIEAEVLGVEADGRLEVVDEKGKHLFLNAGEVTLKEVYKKSIE